MTKDENASGIGALMVEHGGAGIGHGGRSVGEPPSFVAICPSASRMARIRATQRSKPGRSLSPCLSWRGHDEECRQRATLPHMGRPAQGHLCAPRRRMIRGGVAVLGIASGRGRTLPRPDFDNGSSMMCWGRHGYFFVSMIHHTARCKGWPLMG